MNSCFVADLFSCNLTCINELVFLQEVFWRLFQEEATKMAPVLFIENNNANNSN